MASGRQIAEENVQTFNTWRASKTDDDFRAMASRGVLSRKEISKECGFAKSVLDQNPRIKAALKGLEEDLRARGVLPPAVSRSPDEVAKPLMREPGKLRAALDAERLRRLEQENASLRAENVELKRALEQHSMLREALALTGRLPR
ncbi:MAG: hypothetical protein K0M39_08760 [Rhizobium sp.]|nr:hypothetical protein [Rhizobium sp.]